MTDRETDGRANGRTDSNLEISEPREEKIVFASVHLVINLFKDF